MRPTFRAKIDQLDMDGLVRWPMVMGAIVAVVNLGKITKWDDPAIKKLKPNVRFAPSLLREAASALSLPRSLVIQRIAYRAGCSGLITGVLPATARVAEETAPLWFTALSNQFFILNLAKVMVNLPVTINNFVQSPYA